MSFVCQEVDMKGFYVLFNKEANKSILHLCIVVHCNYGISFSWFLWSLSLQYATLGISL